MSNKKMSVGEGLTNGKMLSPFPQSLSNTY